MSAHFKYHFVFKFSTFSCLLEDSKSLLLLLLWVFVGFFLLLIDPIFFLPSTLFFLNYYFGFCVL